MNIDQGAIGAVTQAMRKEIQSCRAWDLEELAVVAVTTLQGLGWHGPVVLPAVHPAVRDVRT